MDSGKIVEFNKTTFYRGMNAAFGKIPVRLELCLDFQDDTASIKLGLFTGIEKVYRVSDIGNFMEALESLNSYHFSKNFIFEPERMYLEKADRKILEFLKNLKARRNYTGAEFDRERLEFHTNELVLNEDESEKLLDFIWDDVDSIRLYKQSNISCFENDMDIKMEILKDEHHLLLTADYSAYGDFQPVSIDFRYIAFRDKKLVVRLPEAKRDMLCNLYQYKNEQNLISFRIDQKDKKLFKKNFIDRYKDKFEISMESSVEKEIMENSLISRTYFDVASKGIVSKIEFCYKENVINPLDSTDEYVSFREYESERMVVTELKAFGFREYGRLFLLDNALKIMNLLTDKLQGLKKISEVYYSEDFKKLYVKDLEFMSLSLSPDGSVIHMNINLENISDEELAELLDSIKTEKKYYRLRNGSIINLASVESSKFIDLINSLEIDKSSINNGLFEVPLNRCHYIDNYIKENGMENVSIESRLEMLLNSISNPTEIELSFDKTLNGILRNYQTVGVKWLKTMAQYSFGGILADDMGLGKTIQVLAFIEGEKNRELPCMVVAPTSVVYNWKTEAEKFVPGLKVLMVSGTKEKRMLDICLCNEYDLVITSYGALRNDIEDYSKIRFSYVFVDEAQNIKNPLTLNASSVKSLKAKCRFALTGTPVENRLTELWSIFDFIMPGYLYNRKKFVDTFEEPIIRDKNKDKINELSSLIKPFIMRRLKKDVLNELPSKIETNYMSDMTDEQKKLYAAYYKDFKNELAMVLDDDGILNNHIKVFAALTRLRQICAHPGTFMDDYEGGSCKLDIAMELISESINSGHSILLFSQFTKMLKIIRTELEKSKIRCYYLDGSMKPEERAMEIDDFNNDNEAVFLISLKAGGTGLNLTKADIVIHFDPWWNPAVETQASDRAHRIGQDSVVQVYKLITEGTIEEKIAELQERKRDLTESIIKPGENFIDQLGENEIRELFQL